MLSRPARPRRALAWIAAASLFLAPASHAAEPVEAKGLTKAQFDSLPDTAVLRIRGKTYTKAELRALEARHVAARGAGLPALRQKAKSGLAAAEAAFQAEEKARLFGLNAGIASRFGSAHRVTQSVGPGDVARVAGPMTPLITGVEGKAEPGASLYVEGKNFGASGDAGKVELRGLPGGTRTLAFDPAFLFPWAPTGVAVVVPDVSGVLDQDVSIVVVTKAGTATAPRTIPFHAARVVVAAFPNTVEKCGKAATDNACLAYDFFEGQHYEDTFWEDDSADCDLFTAVAGPHWTFERFQISNESSGGEIGHPGAVRSGNDYKWQVCWSVNGAGPYSGNHASYVGYLMIRGPKGVP
jgi:hypothetical protein